MFYVNSRYAILETIGVWLLWSILSPKTVQADMMITIDPKSFQAQSMDYFDVYLESDTDQTLSLASYMLEITPHSGNTASLYFRDSFDSNDLSNPNNQSNSEQFASNYIFFGNTLDTNFSAVRQFNPLQLVGSDLSEPFPSGVSLWANQKYLLTRVEIYTENPGTGTFTVNLVNDPNQTFFWDADENFIPIDASSFDGSTFSISSVPEPSSMLLGLLGTSLAGVYRWRRTRCKKPLPLKTCE
ncbi:MAG: PEP-CTERM sorting domain-containing protein [Planctomycetaceae bacterium]|nr:PEP-CTERM sorting domain-containing protein [Planctomycetaceae bacterium]